MGASESMFDGVSGLDNHQEWMNIIGNNIANVNTSGFKDELFNFADVVSQTIKGASSAVNGGPGGTNPEQIGLGTFAGSIVTNEQQGSMQTTNLSTDFAIQGDGFFMVSDGNATHYTRDSNFIVDGFGNINQASTGFHLRGYGLKQQGNAVAIDTSKVVNLTVPQQINPAQQTNVLDLFGNLQSSTTTNQQQSIGVYDSLGQLHNVVLTFAPPTTSNGNWTVTANSADLANGAAITVTGGNVNGSPGQLHFNQLGQLDGSVTPLMLTYTDATSSNPANAKPPEPWLIPGTTTLTNAIQAAVQLNLVDNAVGALTSFASPTATQTQAVPKAVPLLGTQSNNTALVTGNFQQAAAPGNTTLTFTAADSNGYTHTFVITETPAAGGTNWTAGLTSVDGAAAPAGTTLTGGPTTYTGGANSTQNAGTGTLTLTVPAGAFATTAGNNPNDVNLQMVLTIDLSQVTNTGLESGLIPPSTGSAGNGAGSLKDFNVDQNGVVHGVYTNGFTQTIGQILLATFENPAGLQKLGNNDLDISANSGVVNVGTPGSGKFGTIVEGNIETSNVDLATEFSNMILAERGFQSNSRIITTSDEMLQELINLKR